MKKITSIIIVAGALMLGSQNIQASSYGNMYTQCIEKFNGDSCAELGLYTIRKRGETVKGLQFIQRGCKLDNTRSCTILGNVFKDGIKACPNPYLAKRYYDKACRLGQETACEAYNKYRPDLIIKKKSDNIIQRLFDIQTKEIYINGCKCPSTPTPKKECVDHSVPQG